MNKQKFSPLALDQLLSDAMENTSAIQAELKEDETDIVPAPAVSASIDKLVNQKNGESVDYTRVYAQLERLIENGNIALQILGAIDPDVSGIETATATASLMNAIKNCVAEFTKIHLQHIKFQQIVQLEEIKHRHKIEQLKLKKEIMRGEDSNEKENITELIPWETEGAAAYLNYIKQRDNENKERL